MKIEPGFDFDAIHALYNELKGYKLVTHGFTRNELQASCANKSQACRMVNRLIEEGVIEQIGVKASRDRKGRRRLLPAFDYTHHEKHQSTRRNK